MDEAAQQMLGNAGYDVRSVELLPSRAMPAAQFALLDNGEYLGLGPSAQSYLDGTRFGNVADLAAYDTALAASHLPIEDRTRLSEKEQLRDAVIFGLGLFKESLTEPASACKNYGHAAITAQLLAQQLIEEEGTRSRLSQEAGYRPTLCRTVVLAAGY